MEKKVINYKRTLVNLIFSLIGTAIVVGIGIKAFFFFMPFVLGWLLSCVAFPVVKAIEKRVNNVRKLSSAMIIIGVLGILVLMVYLAIRGLIIATEGMIDNLPEYYEFLKVQVLQVIENLSGLFAYLPEEMRATFGLFSENMSSYIADIFTAISEPTVSAAGNVAMMIPTYLVYFIVIILSAYFFTSDRENVLMWINKYVPQFILQRMDLVNQNLKHGVGGYFKAQFKIMGVIFLILAISLSLLGVQYSIFVAFIIALLDFFPVFGTGTIMIPWILFVALANEYKFALFLTIIYIITQVVRQLIQPKLVADSIGMNPLLTLVLLFVGFQWASVLGMIIAIPIGLILINLVKAGAFDYIIGDVKILAKGILNLRKMD